MICLPLTALILLLTLSARAIDATLSPQVDDLVGGIRSLFHAPWFTRHMLEKGANVLLFAPLGAALAVGLGRHRWLLAAGIGAALSAAVELAQLLFLHGRTASVVDFVLNSFGSIVGAVVARALLSQRDRRVQRRRTTDAGGGVG